MHAASITALATPILSDEHTIRPAGFGEAIAARWQTYVKDATNEVISLKTCMVAIPMGTPKAFSASYSMVTIGHRTPSLSGRNSLVG